MTDPLTFIEIADVPHGTAYVLDPATAASFLQYPELATALAKGENVVVTGPDSRRKREQIEAALQRVGKISGLP